MKTFVFLFDEFFSRKTAKYVEQRFDFCTLSHIFTCNLRCVLFNFSPTRFVLKKKKTTYVRTRRRTLRDLTSRWSVFFYKLYPRRPVAIKCPGNDVGFRIRKPFRTGRRTRQWRGRALKTKRLAGSYTTRSSSRANHPTPPPHRITYLRPQIQTNGDRNSILGPPRARPVGVIL